jgi:hypothetical protein
MAQNLLKAGHLMPFWQIWRLEFQFQNAGIAPQATLLYKENIKYRVGIAYTMGGANGRSWGE